MINLELFSCAGGMAEGFRRAGVTFDVAVDFAPDHCNSYEANIGHRPLCMDARLLLAHVLAGEIRWSVDLLVADPPCTPWSRAGKRLGTEDERDMLAITCSLIAALRPRRYLIGNTPGLDDTTNLHVVQRHIGALARFGYCVRDFARLDAADYGVPQHRIRPWWFGHREGPCIQWPVPTHGDPLDLATLPLPLPNIAPLRPWVTCREALCHLDGDELGRPVKMRKPSAKHEPSRPSRPSNTLGAKSRGNGACAIVLREPSSKHPAATPGAPSPTIRAGGGGHTGPHVMLAPESGSKKRPPGGSGSPVLEWPWPRPSTSVTCRPGLAPPRSPRRELRSHVAA